MIPSTDDERLWFLQSTAALRDVDPADLRLLLPHLDEGCLPVGHVLAGHPASSAVVFVVDGLVEVERQGRRRAVLGPGAVVGPVAGCDGPCPGDTVRAITPLVAHFLPVARFLRARQSRPDAPVVPH